MHILLVTDSYPPEIRSASHLMLELAQELTSRGHQVTVITTWPEYNLAQKDNAESFQECMDENGIQVIRLKSMRHHNVNYIKRGIAQVLMPYLFLRKIRQYKVKVDTVIVYSPPLPLGLVGASLKKRGAKFILNVQDLFPQNAIDLGVLKSSMIIKGFRKLEKYLYKKADIVTLHSDGNKQLVAEQYTDIKHKLTTLHNWVDVTHFQKNNANKDFRDLYNIPKDKIIALFAGVMGPSQHLDLVLAMAKSFEEHKELLVLIVGDGKEKPRLIKKAKMIEANNVMFQSFVNRDDYPSLVEACDFGIVCLSPSNKTPVVPGKILGYMAAKLPILAFLNKKSDGHQIINDAGCGFTANSDDLYNCHKTFKQMLDSVPDFSKLGEAGFNYVTNNFAKPDVIDELEQLLPERRSLKPSVLNGVGESL